MPRSNSIRPTTPICSWSASGTSITGKPEWFGVCAPSRFRQSSTRAVLWLMEARSRSPRASFTSKPDSTVASDATGDGPE
jgi:hypothetical protein